MFCNTKYLFILSTSFIILTSFGEDSPYLSSIDYSAELIRADTRDINANVTSIKSNSDDIKSTISTFGSDLRQVANYAPMLNQIKTLIEQWKNAGVQVSTANIESLLRGAYNQSVGDSAYISAARLLLIYNALTQLDSSPILQKLDDIFDNTYSIRELDHISNIKTAVENIDGYSASMQMALGGGTAQSQLGKGDILSNTAQLLQGQTSTTNQLKDIQADFSMLTNLVNAIYTSILTNSYNISITNSLGEIDLDTYLTSLVEDISEIEGYLEEFFGGSTFEEGISDITNELSSITHNTQSLFDLTNINSRVADRLDGWDLYYQIFTNYVSVSTDHQYEYYGITKNSDYSGGNLYLTHRTPTISARNKVSFPQAVLTYLDSLSAIQVSANNWQGFLHNDVVTNSINQMRIDTDIYNYLTTNYLNNAFLQGVFNPKLFNPGESQPDNIHPFYASPLMLLPGQVTITQPTSRYYNLDGIMYSLIDYIPAHLSSANQYYYWFYQHWGDLTNTVNDIEVSSTNIIKFAYTNKVDMSFTNAVYNIDSNLLRLVDRVLNVDFSSPLSEIGDRDDYHAFLTNYYIMVSSGSASSTMVHTNWFNRIEMLLAALVFEDNQGNATNIVSQSDFRNASSQVQSFVGDYTNNLNGVQNSLNTVNRYNSSIIDVIDSLGALFEDVSSLPSSGIEIGVNLNGNSDGSITFVSDIDSNSFQFLNFCNLISRFVWTIIFALLMIVYLKFALRIGLNILGVLWEIIQFRKS